VETKLFATQLVERLRKRSEKYISLSPVMAEEKAVARALTETADCVEETLATFDEE
jgi:hypothetical protein